MAKQLREFQEPQLMEMMKDQAKYEYERIPEEFDGEEIEVIFRKPNRDANEYVDRDITGWGYYSPLNQRTYEENGIVCMQDVEIPLRDGTIIYADIYRSAADMDKKVPAIISWGFYGKRPGDIPKTWQVLGVPPKTISKMAKFESPDPGYWTHHGYAIVNVDCRGAGNSQGRLHAWGTQDGKDGYDVIEWLAEQDWCTGKIGLSGNSAVAMCQWFIAAERPPHLACIAPWEGSTDIYRQFANKGGAPMVGFNEFVFRDVTGEYVEDHMAMLKEHPLMDAYWEDKVAKLENIRIPVYMTAGWSHQLHITGAFNAWQRVKSPKKWIRMHREFEWEDLVTPSSMRDLKEFFDRYLREINNGWELTPRVRFELQDAYDHEYIKDRTEQEFPIARTEYRKLYLDAESNDLFDAPVANVSSLEYDAKTGYTYFDYEFTEDTELTGYFKAHIWVEAKDADDLDLEVCVMKASADGEFVPTYVYHDWNYYGTAGNLRASLRELDEEMSTDFQPQYTYKTVQKLAPGEIVPLDIEINPTAKFYHKGERLRVFLASWRAIGGIDIYERETLTEGSHVIHTGGEYDSYIQIPVVPPKYVAGDTIYRQ